MHACIHTYRHTYIHACMHTCIHTYCSCLVLSTFNVQCTTGVINFLKFFEPMQQTGSCSHAFPGFNFLNPPPLASVAEMTVVRLPALVLQVANPSSRSHFFYHQLTGSCPFASLGNMSSQPTQKQKYGCVRVYVYIHTYMHTYIHT